MRVLVWIYLPLLKSSYASWDCSVRDAVFVAEIICCTVSVQKSLKSRSERWSNLQSLFWGTSWLCQAILYIFQLLCLRFTWWWKFNKLPHAIISRIKLIFLGRYFNISIWPMRVMKLLPCRTVYKIMNERKMYFATEMLVPKHTEVI